MVLLLCRGPVSVITGYWLASLSSKGAMLRVMIHTLYQKPANLSNDFELKGFKYLWIPV